MRYIRFLKTPRIVEEKNSTRAHIHCLITITSDLGDSFLPYDLNLSAELLSTSPREEVIVWRTVQWKAGMRNLPISLPISQSRPIRVRVGVDAKAHKDDLEKLNSEDARGVVSAWSAPLDPMRSINQAERFVERRFAIGKGECLAVWEETGESIARHLWDAGIMLSHHFHDLISKVIPTNEKAALRVLELGTGCGIVGISIAQAIDNAEVLMTDLLEASEIVDRNIRHAKTAPGSTMRFLELNWDEELPRDLYSHSDDRSVFDVIVAADCTYNSDSSPALVDTLDRLAAIAPGSVIMIAMKKRHSSEEIFFELMSEKSFKVADMKIFPLPGDDQVGEETVFVYIFQQDR